MKKYLAERKEVLILGVLVMLMTSIPYLIGYASQGEEWHFTGFLIGVEDGNSYIAKMLTGSDGNWLFRSPYSAEPQAGVLAFLPYLLLGKLTAGAAQHEQLVALFHLYRILAGILAALAIYDFISLYLKSKTQRVWAVMTIMVGGGLGWIVAAVGMKNLLGSIPVDFLSPESFGFLGLFGLPHLSLGRAFLFWGMVSYLRGNNAIRAGLIWLMMGLLQPMYVVLAWVVIGVHSIAEVLTCVARKSPEISGWTFKSSYLKTALISGLISSPLVFYTAWAFIVDPYLSAWAAQNFLPSPHWLHYLIAYGLVLPFSFMGLFQLWKRNHRYTLFLACWIGVFPILINAPVTTQRRLAEGIWVILITAAFGLIENKETVPVYGKFIVSLLFPTTIFILVGAASRAAQPSSPIFLPINQAEAYHAIKGMTPENGIVLSSFEVGNSLPAWAPVRVVQGHGPESIHLDQWQSDLEDYFHGNIGDLSCGNYFYENQINYLFWGPVEEAQWDWNPEIKNCLRKVYNSDGYRIYQVIN